MRSKLTMTLAVMVTCGGIVAAASLVSIDARATPPCFEPSLTARLPLGETAPPNVAPFAGAGHMLRVDGELVDVERTVIDTRSTRLEQLRLPNDLTEGAVVELVELVREQEVVRDSFTIQGERDETQPVVDVTFDHFYNDCDAFAFFTRNDDDDALLIAAVDRDPIFETGGFDAMSSIDSIHLSGPSGATASVRFRAIDAAGNASDVIEHQVTFEHPRFLRGTYCANVGASDACLLAALLALFRVRWRRP